MFQNIDVKNADTTVNEEESNYNKGKFEVFNRIIGQALTKQNLLLYLISFMMSMVSCGDGIAPFGMAIFAAACSNSVPVIFIYIVTMIGTALKFGSAGVLNYLLISLLFIAMILIFKPWYQEEYKNERRKLGRYVFIATLIIQTVGVLIDHLPQGRFLQAPILPDTGHGLLYLGLAVLPPIANPNRQFRLLLIQGCL